MRRVTGLTGPKGILKGIAVGLAVIVPGMSAGTAALILGIYRPMIFALRSWKLVRLLPLAAGTVLGILAGARTIGWLLETAPDRLGAFLAGLVISATWPVLLESLGGYDGQSNRDSRRWLVPVLLTVSGFVMVWMMAPQPLRPEGTGGPVWLLTAGLLSASAMLLPGISGSTVLIILGEYGRLVQAINGFDLILLGIFAVGVVGGLLGFVQLVAVLLERYPAATMALLGGMMLGSVRHLIPAGAGLPELAWLVIGFAVIVPFWRSGVELDPDAVDPDGSGGEQPDG